VLLATDTSAGADRFVFIEADVDVGSFVDHSHRYFLAFRPDHALLTLTCGLCSASFHQGQVHRCLLGFRPVSRRSGVGVTVRVGHGRTAECVFDVVRGGACENTGENKRERHLEHRKTSAYNARVGFDDCPHGGDHGPIRLVD